MGQVILKKIAYLEFCSQCFIVNIADFLLFSSYISLGKVTCCGVRNPGSVPLGKTFNVSGPQFLLSKVKSWKLMFFEFPLNYTEIVKSWLSWLLMLFMRVLWNRWQRKKQQNSGGRETEMWRMCGKTWGRLITASSLTCPSLCFR